MRVIYGEQYIQWTQEFISNIMRKAQPPPVFDANVFFWLLAIPFLYTVIFWVFTSGLPAQHFFKLKVVHHQTYSALNPLQAGLRYVGLNLLLFGIILTQILAPLMVIMILFFINKHPKKRGLHDVMGQSVVIIRATGSSHNSEQKESVNDITEREF